MVGLRRSIPWVLGVLLGWGLAEPAGACPFCTMQGKTLLDELNQASMVLYGTMGKGDEDADTTPFRVKEVIKDHPFRAKRKTITLKRYIPPAPDGQKYEYLIFCDIFRKSIDPYRGLALKPGNEVARYLRGTLAVRDKPLAEKLLFFFKYLDNDDIEISNDAYKEFGNADYKDFRPIAGKFPAATVIKWLKDPDTPAFRIGLYASMLGHCGKPKDAGVLKDLLKDPDKRAATGIDGVLAAYVMLEPKEGWKYLQKVLTDAREEFSSRYAALRAVRFLHEYRPDLISQKELVEGVCKLLDQEELADLAIEDLRKWGCWDKTDKVLAVRKTEVYKQPIVERAVLRFCLSIKDRHAGAKAYVAERRKEDAEAVKEAEELLELEKEPPAPPAREDKK
jgi:hypothetical protein